MSTPTLEDVRLVLEVLYQSHIQLKARKYTFTSLTVEQIAQAAEALGLPLPENYESILTWGVKKGTFTRCAESGTENTDYVVLLYDYNPQMLRINYTYNSKVLRPSNGINYIDYQNVQGGYVSHSSTYVPYPGWQGSLNGVDNMSTATATDGGRIPDHVFATLRKCC